jgi:hypothetical protein
MAGWRRAGGALTAPTAPTALRALAALTALTEAVDNSTFPDTVPPFVQKSPG